MPTRPKTQKGLKSQQTLENYAKKQYPDWTEINVISLDLFSKEDHEFIDFLFGKLTCLTDTEMIDLQDDDSCCDHLEFKQLENDDNV